MLVPTTSRSRGFQRALVYTYSTDNTHLNISGTTQSWLSCNFGRRESGRETQDYGHYIGFWTPSRTRMGKKNAWRPYGQKVEQLRKEGQKAEINRNNASLQKSSK